MSERRGEVDGSGTGFRRLATFARLLVFVLASTWVLGVMPDQAHAHTLDTQGYSEIRQRGDDVEYELLVDYAAFAIVAGLGSPGAASYDDAEADLRAGVDHAGDYLDERLQVLVDDVPCPAEITGTDVESRFEQPYAKISLHYDCPGDGAFTIRYSVLVGDLDPNHRNVAGYELGGATGEYLFDSDDTELVVGEASLPRQAYRFAVLGFEHILGGLDHLLFVAALVIGARGVRDVLGVVTAFTLAHSVTLALAALDVVRVPASVVEPLIALSVVYVAATGVLGRGQVEYRWPVVFGFGLLHGLGFAGALQFTGDVSGPMLSSLLSFNVGIELGQALVVAVLFPFFVVIRKFAWSRYVAFGATCLIALVGLVWFVERLVAA